MSPVLSTLRSRWSRLTPNVRGALWLVLAGLLLVGMNVFVKLLGARLPPAEMLFFRGAFGTLFLVPFVAWHGWRSVTTAHPGMHMLRTGLGTLSMFGLFYAITHMPLADATAIIFSSPLFATIFAALLLGEAVGWRRATATMVGFAGVVVMIRPGTEGLDPVALVAVGSAFMTGLLAIIIRRLSGKDSPYLIVFWFTVGNAVLTLPAAAALWVTPVGIEWLMLGLVGLLGLIGQVAFTFAFSAGEPSAVAPFDYLRLVFAGITGYVFFAELPDGWSLAGAAIIMASTFYILRREARLARDRRAVQAASLAREP